MEIKLMQIINYVTKNNFVTINREDKLRDDLNISSLEYINIVVEIENNFKVDLPDEALIYENEITFGDLLYLLSEP